ncbi:MAG: sec-independent protein translocase protein TatC [Archaeoglobaceae archaeon]|nr:sec-independent protein translocase protein TatC [Archaeoglobaceae archaeon]
MQDKEQRVTEHIAELRARVIRIGILLLLLLPIVFYFSPVLIQRFWEEVIKEEMFAYSPLEWILLRLVFSLILSLIILYPYAMFELYMFAKPGLYETERRILKFAIIPSYLLFLAGSYISFEFLVPFLYSLSYGNAYYSVEKTALNALKISFALGIFLQIPFAIFLLDKFRIVSYQTMKSVRLPIYIFIFAIILNSSEDLGGLTQIITLISSFIMYELGLFMLRLSKR